MVLAPIIGAFSNAMRGGQFHIPGPVKVYNGLIFGALSYYYGYQWWSALMAVGMFVGSKPGWGDYIGAMIGTRTTNLHEGFLDRFITHFINRPRLWGFLGLSLRGLLWGSVLALSSLNPLFLIGSLMGVAYFIAIEILRPFGKPEKGWPLGEWIFGALLWSVL